MKILQAEVYAFMNNVMQNTYVIEWYVSLIGWTLPISNFLQKNSV